MSNASFSNGAAEWSTDLHLSDTVTESAHRPRDLATALSESPELARDRSLVIERAIAEYRSLTRRDPALSSAAYCERFARFGSSLKSSIARQLEVERFISRHPWLLDEARLRWPTPGDVVGRFEVLEELGRGGLARVYLCRQRGVGNRQVVVKLGRSVLVEAHTLGRLRHPNIVPIHSAEIDPDGGLALLCMPFLGRSTLHDLIDAAFAEGRPAAPASLHRAAVRWQRTTDELIDDAHHLAQPRFADYWECVAYIGQRMADALQHAHSQGIVHGDLKPSNIILSHRGEPLLVDFNLSGNADLDIAARGGTLPYMPPEQLELIHGAGARGAYDARSDVYSLGAVLYELLTGRPPFRVGEGEDQADQAAALLPQQARGAPPLGAANAEIPAELARAVERCLALAPADRFPTARDAAAALGRAARPRGLSRRWLAERRSILAPAAAAAAALAALGAAFFHERLPAHIRLLDDGMALAASGDMRGAEDKFAAALDRRPDYDRAKFEWARLKLRRGRLHEALEGLNGLTSLAEDPLVPAYTGYCFALQNRYTAAIAAYRRALDLGGDAAEVHNNLSVAYELGRCEFSDAERLERSKRHLATALRMAPDSRTIRQNYVLREVMDAVNANRPVSRRTYAIARGLARETPENAFVIYYAAWAASLAEPSSEEIVAAGSECLLRALRMGHKLNRRLFLTDPSWRALREGPQAAALLAALDAVESPPQQTPADAIIPRNLEPVSLLEAAGHGR